jgi:hypothetical protein
MLGCIFVRKNFPKWIRLKRHFKLCFLRIGSYKKKYYARNYQNYSNLIHDLIQAKKHDELTLKNYHQRSVGIAPLSEVHYNWKGKEKVDVSNKH